MRDMLSTNFNVEMKIGKHTIPQVLCSKYIGSNIQSNRKIEEDVNHRIQARLMKSRNALSLICDKKKYHSSL